MSRKANIYPSLAVPAFWGVRNTDYWPNVSLESTVSRTSTPLKSSWSGLTVEKPDRSQRRRRDTSSQRATLTTKEQTILSVHIALNRKLADMSASSLNAFTSEIYMMEQLGWLRERFSTNHYALSYINGELVERSLNFQWGARSDIDNSLIDDLLAIGFPSLIYASASSPTIVVSPINSQGKNNGEALHVLPLGQVLGATSGITLETPWDKVCYIPLYQKSDDYHSTFTPHLGGLPPEVERIRGSLLWAYNQIRSEIKDRASRCFTAKKRYQRLEQDVRLQFNFSQEEFERDLEASNIINTIENLRGAIAYLAYDRALLIGSAPELDPAGYGWAGYMSLRTMFTALLGELRRNLGSSQSKNLIEPKRVAEAQALTQGSLSALVNANLNFLLNDEVRKFTRAFSKDYPGVLSEAEHISYPMSDGIFNAENKKRMSLSEMLMQRIPVGNWFYVENGNTGKQVSEKNKNNIIKRITKARYNIDTEIPFRFQQLLDSKSADFARVLDTSLELHAHQFLNNDRHRDDQKKLVKDFLAGSLPAYKCIFNGHTIFGVVFIPYEDDDNQARKGADLRKNGMLYSPYDGFTWIETSNNRLSNAQFTAIRNGLTIEGKQSLDAAMRVNSLPTLGVMTPSMLGSAGLLPVLPEPVDPLRLFNGCAGGEVIGVGTLSLYLINSLSEYFDELFDALHFSLQEKWKEVTDHLMLAVSILNIVAIPVPFLGLALIAGNMTIAIVTLSDRSSSRGDKAWAIADLLLEPIGAIGDVITLSKKATATLEGILNTSEGVNSPLFKTKLAELAQASLIEQKGGGHRLQGFVNRISCGAGQYKLTSGQVVGRSKSKGLCRGLALKDAISRLNGVPIDGLPNKIGHNVMITEDVMALHRTQPVVRGRAQVLRSDEAILATRKEVEAPERGGNHVTLDEEMTYSRVNKELLVQMAKHAEVSFVIGTRTHAVSLSKRLSGEEAGLTFFDPAKQTRCWSLDNEELVITELLDYIASRYDSGLAKKVGDNPLSLTVLTKQPETRFVYITTTGIDSLKAAVGQLELDALQGRQLQPILVRGQQAKEAMEADLLQLKTDAPEQQLLLDNLVIETVAQHHLNELSIENTAITVIGQQGVDPLNIAQELKSAGLPLSYIDIRYLDNDYITSDAVATQYLEQQTLIENVVQFGTTRENMTTPEVLEIALAQAGFSQPRVRYGYFTSLQGRNHKASEIKFSSGGKPTAIKSSDNLKHQESPTSIGNYVFKDNLRTRLSIKIANYSSKIQIFNVGKNKYINSKDFEVVRVNDGDPNGFLVSSDEAIQKLKEFDTIYDKLTDEVDKVGNLDSPQDLSLLANLHNGQEISSNMKDSLTAQNRLQNDINRGNNPDFYTETSYYTILKKSDKEVMDEREVYGFFEMKIFHDMRSGKADVTVEHVVSHPYTQIRGAIRSRVEVPEGYDIKGLGTSLVLKGIQDSVANRGLDLRDIRTDAINPRSAAIAKTLGGTFEPI